jgi:hypothetical protein
VLGCEYERTKTHSVIDEKWSMSGHKALRNGPRAKQTDLPTDLDEVIAQHPKGMAVLQASGARQEQIKELLRKIQLTFYHPFRGEFSLPIGMTRKTLNGLVRRIDDLAEDLEKLNSNDTYSMAAMSVHLNDRARKLINNFPLEKYLAVLPAFLQIQSTLLRTQRKTVGKIQMGIGKDHLPRKVFLRRLFGHLKQPVKASDYRSVGELLDALAPESNPAFDEASLRKLHKTTLKRTTQTVS